MPDARCIVRAVLQTDYSHDALRVLRALQPPPPPRGASVTARGVARRAALLGGALESS